MQRTVYLDLYGEVSHDAPEDAMAWDLYQTEAVSRIREISLSSTPSAFAPHGVALSRFQHSVAVGHLARKLCDWRPTMRPWRDALIAAGICHDLGSPPFSHIAEAFSYALTGRTHEQDTARVLESKGEIGKLLRSYDVDPAEVVALINGDPTHPLGALIAGSLDLDNISNSQDLLRSLGYRDELLYHPLRLVEAFRFQQNKLLLDSAFLKELLGWAEARRKLYDLLYSEPNQSATSMLYRALEYAFAEGALDEGFFRLSEPDALHFLRHEVGGETQKLIQAEYQWRHYPRLLETSTREEDMRVVSLYDNWELRKEFTDELARSLKIKPVELCLYVGRDRGEKAITLPFIGERMEAATALFAGSKGRQRVALFAHKRHLELRDSDRVREAIAAAITELPVAETVGHVFV
jgi:HD superfamily phosphohydrolase